MLIDAHVHVLGEDAARYPRVPGAHAPGDFVAQAVVTTDQLLGAMDREGVDRAVIVQPFGTYGYDNAYHADSACEHPDRLISLCGIDSLADDAPEQLGYWISERGMKGARLPRRHGGDWLDDPRTDRLMEQAKSLNIPVTMLGGQEYMDGVRRLAMRFPAVPLVLDHIGTSGKTEGIMPKDAFDVLLEMAELPNVSLKVTTINLVHRETGDGVREDMLRQVIERFGTQRIMWGSNNPESRECSYAEMVALARTALPWLPDEERELLLGGVAERLWPSLRVGASK